MFAVFISKLADAGLGEKSEVRHEGRVPAARLARAVPKKTKKARNERAVPKRTKKAGNALYLQEVGYGVAGNVDAGHCRHALHRRVKTRVEVANGIAGGGNAGAAAAKKRKTNQPAGARTVQSR